MKLFACISAPQEACPLRRRRVVRRRRRIPNFDAKKTPNLTLEERRERISRAMEWLTAELALMKLQDRALVGQFATHRGQLEHIKQYVPMTLANRTTQEAGQNSNNSTAHEHTTPGVASGKKNTRKNPKKKPKDSVTDFLSRKLSSITRRRAVNTCKTLSDFQERALRRDC